MRQTVSPCLSSTIAWSWSDHGDVIRQGPIRAASAHRQIRASTAVARSWTQITRFGAASGRHIGATLPGRSADKERTRSGLQSLAVTELPVCQLR